jgi:hypothetical protein
MLGIVIGLLAGARFQFVDGVVEIYGPRVTRVLRLIPIGPIALTLGHVVFGVDRVALDTTRRHERVHVRQYERWGLFFLPAYLLESLWLYGRGRDGYRENHFEVEAYAIDGSGDPVA